MRRAGAGVKEECGGDRRKCGDEWGEVRRRWEKVRAGLRAEAPKGRRRGYFEKVKPAGRSLALVSAGTKARSVMV